MRIITPYGKVRKIKSVEICTEMLIDFNGRKILKSEKAIIGVEPNAIFVSGAIEDNRGNIFQPCITDNFIIGNLTPKVIKDITSQLCEKGFYDFSSLEYQTYKNINELVIDGGKSLPYVNYNVHSYAGDSINNEIYPTMAQIDGRICARVFDEFKDIDCADEFETGMARNEDAMSCDEEDMDTEGDEYSDDDMDTEGDEE